MKKIGILLVALLAFGSATVSAQDFDTKLKRFITIEQDGKCAPEISCDEAIKLGFTVNDYKRFTEYVDRLNTEPVSPVLTAPENRFLSSFIEFRGGKAVLNIPLEKALRAGATVEGYRQVQQTLRDNDTFLKENGQKAARSEYIDHIKAAQQHALEFARQHPDSSAVQLFFGPSPMPVADK